MIGIYTITNIVNNKVYVGQSIDIERRWRDHKNSLNSGRHGNDHFQRAWDYYGKDNFLFTIIEECLREDLDIKERYWINIFNSVDKSFGYNLVEFSVTHKQTRETREKISKSRTGMKFSDKHKENIRLARIGKKASEDTRKKLREIAKTVPVGADSPSAKLTDAQAKQIVSMLAKGIRITDVAKITGANYNVIKAIKQKRSWRHLTKEVSFVTYDGQGRIKNCLEKVS